MSCLQTQEKQEMPLIQRNTIKFSLTGNLFKFIIYNIHKYTVFGENKTIITVVHASSIISELPK